MLILNEQHEHNIFTILSSNIDNVTYWMDRMSISASASDATITKRHEILKGGPTIWQPFGTYRPYVNL